jgi:UrcA family protein
MGDLLMLAHSAYSAVVTVSVLCLGAAGPAPNDSYWTDGQTVAVAVHYGDLYLASPAGAQTLLSRIRQAAMRVCGPEPADRLSFQRQYDECVRETVNRALIDESSASFAATGRAPLLLGQADRG